MRTPNVKPEQYEYIKKLYYDDMKSQKEVGIIIGVSQKCIFKLFERMNWPRRTRKEAAIIKKYSSGLDEWREKNGSWCKGLTKDDPKIKKIIDKGKDTQIKNGKSKGSNNPMYGKVSKHSRSGYRKDLKHFVRSSWEANFARILNILNLEYLYEKFTFTLANGETYTPDFYIPSKDIFYEIKGWESNTKHHRFQSEFPNYKLHIISEKHYNRIISRFGDRIIISDRDSNYTKAEIIELFLNWIKLNDKTISCDEFQKSIGISTKTIKRLFGSQKQMTIFLSKDISKLEISRCVQHFIEFRMTTPNPTRRMFYTYYTRAATIINRNFGNFGEFVKFYNHLPNLPTYLQS